MKSAHPIIWRSLLTLGQTSHQDISNLIVAELPDWGGKKDKSTSKETQRLVDGGRLHCFGYVALFYWSTDGAQSRTNKQIEVRCIGYLSIQFYTSGEWHLSSQIKDKHSNILSSGWLMNKVWKFRPISKLDDRPKKGSRPNTSRAS